MNKHLAMAILAPAVLLASVWPVHAQIAPIRLKVTKNSRKEMDKASHQVREFESYRVELANASTAPVSNIVVRWGMLVSPNWYYAYAAYRSTRGPNKIVEGEHACSIDRMQKCIFDTDEIQTDSYSKQEYSLHEREEVIGYYVEALVNGAVAASDNQPSNAKTRIQEEKANQGKKKPKR